MGEALLPGLCTNHRELDPNQPLVNARLGCDNAEQKMGIPQILSPEDMIDPVVDELSVMTYISYFRDWEANEAKKKSTEELEKKAIASKCRAYGPGVEKAETHIPTEFTIEAINQFGRRVPHGNDPFIVTVKGPRNEVPFEIQDNQDGTYKVNYTPTEIGRHVITVQLTGQNIQGSPYSVPVSRSPPDASQSKAYGPGIEPGNQAGLETHFTLQSLNKLGQQLKDGGDKWDVKIQGPYDTDVSPAIVDNKDGTYTVKYKPLDNGNHVVTINVNGQPIPQSPINVVIERSLEDADALQCVAYGPGLESGTTAEPAIFTVETRNSQGNKINKGGLPIDAEVYDSEGSEVAVKVQDNQDGSFTVTYQPLDAGVHEVHVLLRHKTLPLYYEHIQKSPFKVGIEAGADANKTIAFGPGLEDNVTDQLATHFTIQTKDRNGNNIPKGGDTFDIKVTGPNGEVPATIKDNEDGTYRVEYAPTEHGKHRIDVQLKGKPIAKSPYHVNVKEGADPEHSIIEGYSFVIQAKSKSGSNRKDGGDKFAVTIDGPSGPVQGVDVKDIGNGTYVVSYKLPSAGNYTIHVTLNGVALKGYENGIQVTY